MTAFFEFNQTKLCNQVPFLSLSRWRTLILENWRSLLILAWNMLNWKIQLNANTPSERISSLCTWQCKNQMRWNPKYLPTSLEFWILTTHCSNSSNSFKTCYSTSFLIFTTFVCAEIFAISFLQFSTQVNSSLKDKKQYRLNLNLGLNYFPFIFLIIPKKLTLPHFKIIKNLTNYI